MADDYPKVEDHLDSTQEELENQFPGITVLIGLDGQACVWREELKAAA